MELGLENNMLEQTLFIIKPDSVKRNLVGEILARFEKKGYEIVKLRMFTFTTEDAKIFYSAHSDKSFFNELVTFITSGRVVSAIIQGHNAIATTRLMIGNTKSFEAVPGSIRGDFGTGFTDNVIHASDSLESFKKESEVVFS